MQEPIVVSIPHGGQKVADEVKHIWALSETDALLDGDPFVAQIYDFADRVKYQIAMEYYRAVVDLNREPNDIAPENKDGVIKSHTSYNVEVYKPGCLPDEELKRILLEKYYFPYHQQLEEWLEREDIKMGVDCHSMAAVSPPIEKDAGTPRPLICLGNLGDHEGKVSPPFNRITCSTEMIQFMAEEFARVFQHEDVEVDIPAIATMNVPFSGGYITRKMGKKKIPFLQIEISRALYLVKPFFDKQTLEISEKRLKDINAKVWRVLKGTVPNL